MMHLINLINSKNSDWLNWRYILIDLGIIAALGYFFRQLRKFIVKNSKTTINGMFWISTRVATRSISAQLSMRRYCRNQLATESGRFLQVPGVKGIALDVDEVFVP